MQKGTIYVLRPRARARAYWSQNAYLGREEGSELRFAGTAFLTLAGEARDRLQDRIARLPTAKAPIKIPKVRTPEWVKPELWVRVRHLAGGDTLRHASVIRVEAGR